MKPLVSILIPVHNGERYLASAIQSAIEQSYDNTEIIVVDDNSTDGSVSVIASFDNPRLKFFKGEGPHGIGPAWNRCIELSKGEYFCLLHQDDLLHPYYVREMLKESNRSQATMVHCKACHIDEEGRRRGAFFNAVKYFINHRHPCLTLATIKPLYKYDLIMCPTVFFNREKMQGVGLFSTRLITALDYDMWFRVLLSGGVIQYLPRSLYQYRYHAAMDSKQMREDLTKHQEDFQLKIEVRQAALKKGVHLSGWTLKRSMLVILIKDALIDLGRLHFRGVLAKWSYGLHILRTKLPES